MASSWFPSWSLFTQLSGRDRRSVHWRMLRVRSKCERRLPPTARERTDEHFLSSPCKMNPSLLMNFFRTCGMMTFHDFRNETMWSEFTEKLAFLNLRWRDGENYLASIVCVTVEEDCPAFLDVLTGDALKSFSLLISGSIEYRRTFLWVGRISFVNINVSGSPWFD